MSAAAFGSGLRHGTTIISAPHYRSCAKIQLPQWFIVYSIPVYCCIWTLRLLRCWQKFWRFLKNVLSDILSYPQYSVNNFCQKSLQRSFKILKRFPPGFEITLLSHCWASCWCHPVTRGDFCNSIWWTGWNLHRSRGFLHNFLSLSWWRLSRVIPWLPVTLVVILTCISFWVSFSWLAVNGKDIKTMITKIAGNNHALSSTI